MDDLPAFYDLAVKMHEKTIYSAIKPDRERIVKAYSRCVMSANGFAMVATAATRTDEEGGLNGFLLGVVDELWWAPVRFASDLTFYFEDGWDGKRLLARFIAWAADRKVREINMGLSSGVDADRLGEMYEAQGLHRVGGIYTGFVKDLEVAA